MKSPFLAFTAAVPTKDETDKALERLRGERDTYMEDKDAVLIHDANILREVERNGWTKARLKLQESFKAGWLWAHTAPYECLKEVSAGGGPWLSGQSAWTDENDSPMLYGGHNAKEFQAGARAFLDHLNDSYFEMNP